MSEKLTYLVEGLLLATMGASVILVLYVMMTLSNMQ